MGIKRILQEWREKVDGTLTGPAIETDSATVNGTATTEALEAGSVNTEKAKIGTADVVTGGPMGDKGERVDLVTTTLADQDITTTSNSYIDPTADSDRAVADYNVYPITNVEDYEIRFTVYFFNETTGSGTAELLTSTFGNAPNPLSGLEISVSDGGQALREVITTSVDLSNFGVWTPYVKIRATNTGEAQLQGFVSWTLTGVIK